MLVIRLQRTGRKNLPAYRVVVAEKARPVKGKFLEVVGHYLPTRNPAVFQWNSERMTHWVSRGAIPSDTLARLLSKEGVTGLEKFIVPYTKRKPKGAQEAGPSAQGAPGKPLARNTSDDTAEKNG